MKDMKKIVSIAMVAAALVFSACSNDDENPIDNNGTGGIVLKATIEGQDASTRAVMKGDQHFHRRDRQVDIQFRRKGQDERRQQHREQLLHIRTKRR